MFNKTAKTARVSANNVAADLRGEIGSAAEQYGRKARAFLESAQEEFGDITDTVSDEIRANPWRSGAIALGLGVVIGALIRRA